MLISDEFVSLFDLEQKPSCKEKPE